MVELALQKIPARQEPDYRQPPHNLEAEQALLGALLTNNSAYGRVSELLRPDHFFDPVHGRIYGAIVTLIERGQTANPVTLRGFFERDEALAPVGGANYLVDLAASALSVINAGDYAHTIHDLFLRRQLIQLGEDMVNESHALRAEETTNQLLERQEKRLFDLASFGQLEGGWQPLRQSLASSLRIAEEAFKRDSHITGVTTGLRDMDRKLGGLQKSDLVILAGRPSMGKTALATNIAFNAARAWLGAPGREGAVTGFFSLEMSAEQLTTRLLAEQTGIPSDRIRRGQVKAEDFTRFAEAARLLERLPLYIDDTPALTVSALRTRARQLARRTDSGTLGLIVIDYLQLIQGSGNRRDDNRVQEVSEITRGLKTLAKELNVPVLALSQLSRAVEAREDKRPQLADLRESGSIEQDADVVMFVYREEYYHERSVPTARPDEKADKFDDRFTRWQEHGSRIHNIAEVLIAKQRHGPIGTIKLHFDSALTRFSDLEQTGTDSF